MDISFSLFYFATAIIYGCFAADNLMYFDFIESQLPKHVCSDNSEITDREGLIISPNYPSVYSDHLSCSCHISGVIGDVITLWFDDVDIEESCDIRDASNTCCLFNWLKVGVLANDTEKKICGRNVKSFAAVSRSHKLWIKFHISKFVLGGRGFKLRYKIIPRTEYECESNEFRCDENRCIPEELKCNGFPDCEDGTDEYHCPPPTFRKICKPDELQCDNGQCISAHLRCNKMTDCEDGSDEHHCSNKCLSGRSCRSVFKCYNETQHCDGKRDCIDFSDEIDCGFCPENLIRCGPNSTQCYNPLTQKCDKVFHCLHGEDEKDCNYLCPGTIMCDSRRGCYPVKHRCNGVAQCEDASDEKNCVPELCNYEHGGFLCDNRRCIQQVWTCDHTDDCGDGSDERNCLRNSVLTAAVMGSLICALLLVIAISCTCRLHALRMLEHRLTSRETPLSRLSREFFFREPPPSYAVAVQGSQHHNLYVENLHYGVPIHRGRRRGRRQRHPRNPMIGPQLPSASRNCVLVNPDGTVPSPEPVHLSSVGESSTAVSAPDSSSGVRPEIKEECIIQVPGNSQSASTKHTAEHKVTSIIENDSCSINRHSSDSESLSLEPINVSVEEASDSVILGSLDHYYCDSDSEPLVP